MSTLRISNIEAKADSSSPTVDEQLKFTNSDGDVLLHLDGRTAGITTVGINTTNSTIKFDANNNILITGIVTATEFHGTLAVGTSVTYGDNEKEYFGTGLDLELFHNGTNSVINNTTGALLFQNNGSSSMYIASDGQVSLNNDITFVGASANALWDKSENYFSIPDKIVHSGDTDTFIRFPSNDSFSVTTNNVTRMTFTGNFIDLPDAGTFRLGNSNDLQIYHGSGGASNIIHSNTSQPLIISATGAGSIRFDTNSGTRLNIASDGKIDIGGSTKTGNAARLTVTHSNNSGVGLIDMDAYGSATLQIRSNWSGSTINGMPNETFGFGTPHAYPLVFTTSGAERVRIDSSGRLFVNRTAQHASSSERLSVNGMTSIQYNSTSTASLYIFNEESTTSGNPIQPFIYFHDGSGIRSGFGVQRSTGYTIIGGHFGLSFRTGASGVGGTERLHISSTGALTSSGTAATFNLTNSGTNATEQTATFLASNSGTHNRVVIKTSTNNGGDPYIKFDAGGQDMVVGTRYAGTTNNLLVLGPGLDPDTTSGIFVKGNGNIGINQTSPQRILHVGTSGTAEANIRIQGGSDYGEIRVKDSDNELSFHHNVGGAGSRELFSANGSTGHFSINCYSYEALTLTTNENGSNGPQIQLMHNSASPAANDYIGQLRFSGKDSAGDTTLYSKIETKLDSVTNGSEGGHIDFSTRGGGAFNTMFRLKARSTASYPSYTADDINGIILDTYNTGNPYPRYMSFIAKAAGNTASNIKFFTEAVGGDPSEKMSIHSDGMMSLKQDGTSKTYFQSSGRQGSYSSLTIVIDAHAYHSFVITVSHAGYGGVWGTAKYMGYENGSMYNANEGTETTDSNSRNITHDQNPGGGHKHRIRITGGMGTHPTCELRISLGGDGYIDSDDITFTWS